MNNETVHELLRWVEEACRNSGHSPDEALGMAASLDGLVAASRYIELEIGRLLETAPSLEALEDAAIKIMIRVQSLLEHWGQLSHALDLEDLAES